jgi:hypothetical protein
MEEIATGKGGKEETFFWRESRRHVTKVLM